ncbi:hypothetical protein ADL26_19240, partial [Thermoactinomyces vulgaris]
DALPAAHHQLLAHGLAVRALRAAGAPFVMLTNSYTPAVPFSGNENDLAAATAADRDDEPLPPGSGSGLATLVTAEGVRVEVATLDPTAWAVDEVREETGLVLDADRLRPL